MGSIGPAEILVVLVVALVVLGPTRLPDAARSLGKAVAEFRKVSSGLQAEVRDAFSESPPTYPSPPHDDPGTAAEIRDADERSETSLPTSPEQAEIVVVREPESPPTA